MKYILNRIYYSFYKVENYLYPYGKKGGYSGGIMLNLITGFEIGLSLLIAGLLTHLLVRNLGYERLTVFLLLVITIYLLLICVEKRIWKEPSEEELKKYEDDRTSMLGWLFTGLLMLIFSFVFMIISILILIRGMNIDSFLR